MVWKSFKKSNKLNIIKKDIRNLDDKVFNKVDTVVHLANIANDPSAILNPNLSWEINVLGTKKLWSKQLKKLNILFLQAQEVFMELKKRRRLQKI